MGYERLKSPGIKFYESSVTPPMEVSYETNGLATLGFSTRGPVNEVTRLESASDFAAIFGDPCENYPWAHILANSVLSNDGIVYFMRLADNTAKEATCPVSNIKVVGAAELLREKTYKKGSYFTAQWHGTTAITAPSHTPYLRVIVNEESVGSVSVKAEVYAKMSFATQFGDIANCFYVSMANIVEKLKSEYNSRYSFTLVGNQDEGYGILVKHLDSVDGQFTSPSFEVGYYVDGEWTTWPTTGTGIEYVSNLPAVIKNNPKTTGEIDADALGYLLSPASSVGSAKLSDHYHFNIKAKFSGSGMNGVRVEKATATSSMTGKQTWSVVVRDTNGQVLESRSGIEPSKFIEVIEDKLSYIEIADEDPALYDNYFKTTEAYYDAAKKFYSYDSTTQKYSEVTGDDLYETVATPDWSSGKYYVKEEGVYVLVASAGSYTTFYSFKGTRVAEANRLFEKEVLGHDIEWKDGVYVLGFGELLDEDTELYFTKESIFTDEYKVVSGTDGVPVMDDGSEDLDKVIDLHVAGLGNEQFANCDVNTFSLVATPDCIQTLVQNSAIELCSNRGDCMYLIDTPLQYVENGQSGIDQVVDWSNSNSVFQNSQAAIYYGWFAQTNPYDTTKNVWCPASLLIGPKMMALDKMMGEYYAPAGVQNGLLTAADYIYSPTPADRDKMVNEDSHNVVNPIIYSNTRGIMCFAQKTTDRTTSPLNRVGIRRMTNMIKRELRMSLQALLFQPNNDMSRSRARGYCDNIMSGLVSKGFVESYTVNVVSGTGANRNDLNVYLSFAPYGLIEFIYVYVEITDAGVTVSESTSATK